MMSVTGPVSGARCRREDANLVIAERDQLTRGEAFIASRLNEMLTCPQPVLRPRQASLFWFDGAWKMLGNPGTAVIVATESLRYRVWPIKLCVK
jgi:hypothetical protein